ncbi:MAG: hypothetical protein ABI910_21660 [Gemmatimonadota bacterium]
MTNEITAGAVIYVADLGALTAFYAAALGFSERMRDADHVVLETNAFQLVLLKRDSPTVAAVDAGGSPWPRRSDGAIKPVFIVASIGDARAAATDVGGLINAARHEWQFGDYRVCDGLDPEGNAIQLRERRIDPKSSTAGSLAGTRNSAGASACGARASRAGGKTDAKADEGSIDLR